MSLLEQPDIKDVQGLFALTPVDSSDIVQLLYDTQK